MAWPNATAELNARTSISSPVFGALGGGLILMSWFYLLCASLLIGAELNAILLARRRLDQGDRQAAAALADRARALGRNDALLARIARGT